MILIMIITVANQKGGVGKTTTVMNLGVALSRRGQRVLLIDSDPQANLSSYLGVTSDESSSKTYRTLEEIYLSKRTPSAEQISEWIQPSSEGVELIACDQHLSGVEYYLFSRPERERVLSTFLKSLRQRFHYDFILIDTPPTHNLLTLNALVASDGVILPVQPEFFSLEGVVKIQSALEQVNAQWNPGLKLLGVLPTQVSQRRKLTQEVLTSLKESLGAQVFDSQIRENTSIAESSGHAQSILKYDPRSVGASDYLQFAQELMERLNLSSNQKKAHKTQNMTKSTDSHSSEH